MDKLTIKKRCLRCLHVLDAAGNCINKECVRCITPANNTGAEAAGSTAEN